MNKLRSAAVAALIALGIAGSGIAQQTVAQSTTRELPNKVAPVPFGPGERATYRVTYGIAGGVGKGTVEVAGIDTIRGHPAYHLRLAVKGGIPFARVDDLQESWLDVASLYSHRFHQNLHEVKYKRLLTREFFPSEMLWRGIQNKEIGPLAHSAPLDDISIMYWIRTQPLEVGRTYTINRYFKADGNPVVVKVLRRETIKVPAGEFNTIVVQPIIRTKGLFSEGGEAEIFFSDDDRRIIVQITTKLSIGTLKLQLESHREGRPLTGDIF